MTFVTTNERLAALIGALERGDDISPDMRQQLIKALHDLSMYHMIEEGSHRVGNPVAATSWTAGRIARQLHDEYGVSIADAVRAAIQQVDPKSKHGLTFGAIKKKSEEVQSGKTPMKFSPLPRQLIEQAATKLNQRRLHECIMLKLKQK
jgi:hypothetical protein